MPNQLNIFFLFFNKNLTLTLNLFRLSYINSISVFLCFLRISKKNFFNSIKNFFLFKRVPTFKRIFNFFSNYLFLNRYILNIVNSDTVYFNRITDSTCSFKLNIINPRFYFLNYEFKKQFSIARLFFNFDTTSNKKLFNNLKLINHLFSKNVFSVFNFYNYFLFFNDSRFNILLKKNLLLVLYNNSYIKFNINLVFSVGDTLKISFTGDFIYYYMFRSLLKYKKYLNSFNYNGFLGGVYNNKYSLRKKNIIKNKQVFYSYLTYKNFDVNFLTWSFIYLYNINIIKFNFFLKNFINLYSFRLYEWDRR